MTVPVARPGMQVPANEGNGAAPSVVPKHHDTAAGPLRVPWRLAAAVILGSWLVFSLLNRHWYGIFGQLFRITGVRVHPFVLAGFWDVAALVLGAGLVSATVMPVLLRTPPPLVERVLWTVLAGTAAVGVTATGLILTSHLYTGTLAVVLACEGAAAVGLVVVRPGVRQGFGRVRAWWLATAVPETGAHTVPRWARRLLVSYVVLSGLVLLFHAGTTPLYDYDALIYHAAMAKVFVNSHGMPLITGPSPGIEMSANYPPLFPALGAVMLLIGHGNDMWLRMLSAVFGIAVAGGAYAIGRRLLGRSLGLLAAAFTLTAQIVSVYSVYSTVYTLMGFIMAMAFVALIAYSKSPSTDRLVAVGLCLGLFFLCTYQAFVYLVWLPVVGYVIWRHHRGNAWRVTGQAGAVLGPLAVLGAPWYIRNWVVLGDPTYPWYYKIFGGRDLASPLTHPAQASVTNVAQSLLFPQGSSKVADLVELFFFNRNLFPELTPIAVLGFVLWVRHSKGDEATRLAIWLIVPCAVVPVLFFVGSGTFFLRYVIPSVALLALPPAYAFLRLLEVEGGGGALSRRLVGSTLVAGLVFPGLLVVLAGAAYYEYHDYQPNVPFLTTWTNINANPYVFNDVLDDPGDAAFPWVQSHLPPGYRVATYESRLYYLFAAHWQRILFLDSSAADPIWHETNPAAVIQYLRSEHVKYVWLSNIVEVGSTTLPLVHQMAGQIPQLPAVFQKGDDVVYGLDGPVPMAAGSSSGVALADIGEWSGLVVADGRSARRIRATGDLSKPYPDLSSVLVPASGPGVLTLQVYRSDRARHTPLQVAQYDRSGWHPVTTAAAPAGQGWTTLSIPLTNVLPSGFIKVGFSDSSGSTFVRDLRFSPVRGDWSNLNLLGSWQSEAVDGQSFVVGARATTTRAVRTVYCDVTLAIRRGDGGVRITFLPPDGLVNVFQKVGTEEYPLGTFAGTGGGSIESTDLALADPHTARAYLIFDTLGRAFALASVRPVPINPTQWITAPAVLEGSWQVTEEAGAEMPVADRGNGSWTDIRLSAHVPSTDAIRIGYVDVENAVLIMNSVSANGTSHEVAAIRTTGTQTVKYLELPSIGPFQVSGGGYYIQLDTHGTAVPIAGTELRQAAHG